MGQPQRTVRAVLFFQGQNTTRQSRSISNRTSSRAHSSDHRDRTSEGGAERCVVWVRHSASELSLFAPCRGGVASPNQTYRGIDPMRTAAERRVRSRIQRSQRGPMSDNPKDCFEHAEVSRRAAQGPMLESVRLKHLKSADAWEGLARILLSRPGDRHQLPLSKLPDPIPAYTEARSCRPDAVDGWENEGGSFSSGDGPHFRRTSAKPLPTPNSGHNER